ncbi:hypothetical protein E2C01_065315 [Portunus trituberculatus]|uniref:Uncharacterized protein n=1 Tax=Portunus trituberculatus TaxID=210409 RepID=A0A5B7HP92_PORTR|nr:hypothetical protein [Portunus trituberculatus]
MLRVMQVQCLQLRYPFFGASCMDVILVLLVLGLFIKLKACFCYYSAAAMSDGPPHVPRTNVRLHNTDNSSRRHSSRRSCRRRDSVRLRDNADDARGSRRTSSMPLPWSVVLDAFGGEEEALKVDKQRLPPSAGSALAPVGDSTLGAQGPSPSCSPASFSGFSARVNDDEDMSVPAATADSALIQAIKAFVPTYSVSADIDHRVAEMVNFLFDNGLREEDYKAICEDEIVKRPNNFHALASVECNSQVLEALKLDGRKIDFRLREVNKDILWASTIITKFLVALDDLAEQEANSKVAHEVSMINGALALLGNANHRNNLVRRFVMKLEINYKYAHLCSNKVPMSCFLFGDDVSQSARQIEEAEKLRTKFSQKKPAFPFRFTGKRPNGYWNKSTGKGFYTSFCPYG